MLLHLFARCSFLFEALLGKGRGEVEVGRGGGGGKGKGKGRWGPSFAATWPYLPRLIPDNCHVK